MKGIRQCRRCDRTELDTYLSKSALCRDCGREQVIEAHERAWDIAEAHRYDARDSLADALAKSTAVMVAQHEQAKLRRAELAAELERRRAAQRKIVRATSAGTAGSERDSPARRRQRGKPST